MDIQRAEQILYNLANLGNKRAKELLMQWQLVDDFGKGQMIYEVTKLAASNGPFEPDMEYK